MRTLTVASARELSDHIGCELGPSEWISVDQSMIARFADTTGDTQWIHVDVERARRAMPGGTTIAHGFLTLALVPRLACGLLTVAAGGRCLNYGVDGVRFSTAVPAGARIRLRQRIEQAEATEGGAVWVTCRVIVDVEGQARPALVGRVMTVHYP